MSPARSINLTVNGEKVAAQVEDNLTLLALLREVLALTGTKEGCGKGECGACTVIMSGRPVNSCLVLAVEADGCEVLTVEGESRGYGKRPRVKAAGGGGTEGDGVSPLQQAFIDHGAFQCGFCTAGMLMSARALLMRNPDPTEEEVKEAISGNLCRCTGYKPIIDAVLDAAVREREEERPRT
jgi:carbon-monoxide dehydrogenase small subunit